ncbi:hypothetical protein V5O48_015315 [Marasmius crinis-equi]|uniref:F-box domain-containing protein n=1 Tax=Marasmius crinis-equi TaxID=585013 RepID=A0ABR3EUV1_9AGAR
MALIDLSLNPGEIIVTLMHCCTDNICRVELIASDKTVPEWNATMSDEVLSTLVAYLPCAEHFVIYSLSTRHQFGLMHAGGSRLTTLELHNATHISRSYTITQVQMPQLISLHLIDATSYTTGQGFLSCVATWIVAPKLATLTIANCLRGNGFAVRELVRHFSRTLTKFIILDEFGPLDDTPIALPSLPHLQQFEVDILWAAKFLSPIGHGTLELPALRIIVFQATPDTVLKGLPNGVCRWGPIRTSLNAISHHLTLIECCYRARECALGTGASFGDRSSLSLTRSMDNPRGRKRPHPRPIYI